MGLWGGEKGGLEYGIVEVVCKEKDEVKDIELWSQAKGGQGD